MHWRLPNETPVDHSLDHVRIALDHVCRTLDQCLEWLMVNHQSNSLFRVLRDRAYSAQEGKCYWCGQPMALTTDQTNPRMLTGDHLIPYHNGGTTRPGNVVAACRECNNGRHPELNRSKKNAPQTYTHGDTRHRSPFEVLKDA